jgi:hypothetical protein
MTNEQILKVLKQHFVEVVAEGRESTDLYVGKSESFIAFAKDIIEQVK